MIAIKSSSVMLFENLTQRNTGHFAYLLTDCHHITMAKLTIRPSRDGVDLMQCTNVNAHDLNITGGPDDAFALKSDCSLGQGHASRTTSPSRDSTFSASIANAAQIGSETWGDFQNISWSNIKILGGAKSGIGIQMNDGAVIKNVQLRQHHDDEHVVPDLHQHHQPAARRPTKTPGHAENIRFRNITATNIVAGNNPSPQNTRHRDLRAARASRTRASCSRTSRSPSPAAARAAATRPRATPCGASLPTTRASSPRCPPTACSSGTSRALELRDVKLDFGGADQRPAVIARDVDGLLFEKFGAEKGTGADAGARHGQEPAPSRDSAPLPDTMLPDRRQDDVLSGGNRLSGGVAVNSRTCSGATGTCSAGRPRRKR